jgi:hypothetical protein
VPPVNRPGTCFGILTNWGSFRDSNTEPGVIAPDCCGAPQLVPAATGLVIET